MARCNGRIPRVPRTVDPRQPREMNYFENQYRLYRTLLRVVGLWPYQNSVYSTIHRILISTVFSTYSVIQIILLTKSRITVVNCIRVLSSTMPTLLFLCRYTSFISILRTVKFIFNRIEMDKTLLDDQNDVQILTRYIDDSSRMINVFTYVLIPTTLSFPAFLLLPMVLDFIVPMNESRPRYLSYVHVYYIDHAEYVDDVALVTCFVFAIGLVTIICTETALNVVSHYSSGLMKITSRRIQNAVTKLCNWRSTGLPNLIEDYSDFRRIVEIHNRAIECIDLYGTSIAFQYLIASILAVISFAFGLYRLFNAIKALTDKAEIFVSAAIFTTHLIILFLNNYNGQLIINNSIDVFYESYNSSWHCIPVKAQKLLLFIMLRSSVECEYNLSGLFVPCYAGFSTMMSTSFSYFTMMYSLD